MTGRRIAGCLFLGVLLGAALWLVGVDVPFVAAAAAVPLLIGILLDTSSGDDGTLWDPAAPTGSPGARKDLTRLSWALQSHRREGDAVSDAAVTRLRDLASVRLARRGLSLAEGADEERIRALLGDSAYAALTARSTLKPNRIHVDIALQALARLDEKETT